jgi:hypothetical protein
MDGNLLRPVIILCVSAGTLAISVNSLVIVSSCLAMLTPLGVNVDAWHGGICASVQVPVQIVGIVHLTLPSVVAFLLSPLTSIYIFS